MIDDEILEELKEIKSLDEIAKHIAYMLYGNVSVWEENGICYFCVNVFSDRNIHLCIL